MANLLKDASKNLKRIYLKKKASHRRKARRAPSFVRFDVFDLPEKFYKVAPLDWVPGPYQDRLKAVKPVKIARPAAKGRSKSKRTFH